MAKYKLMSIESTNDGTGMVVWDIWALDDDGLVIGARHKTVQTPYAETQDAILAGGAAVINLLKAYAPVGWDSDTLDAMAAANINAGIVTSEAVAFVEGLGGFPREFSL